MKKLNSFNQKFRLYYCLSALLLFIIPFLTHAAIQDYGAESNPTGNPIGGGPGYSRIVSSDQADYIVRNKTELLTALAGIAPGQTIYIDDEAEIGLTGENKIKIPGNITLASGRGRNGSKGALLYSRSNNVSTTLFLVSGENVRITGLRVFGPDTEMSDHTYGGNYRLGAGISSAFTNLEVDNCEIYGWSHAAVFLTAGPQNSHIHHNFIHHNRRYRLGYGVCLGNSTDAKPIFTLIEGNIFDYNRHHIAGTGAPGNSYEARYNISLTFNVSHCFDMHGGVDRGDGTNIAGNSIKIHHNTFRDPSQNAVCIRGVPQNEANIYNNWFYHQTTESAVRQTNSTGNMYVFDNLLGMSPPQGAILPVPRISVSSQIGVSPLTINFDGSGSSGTTSPLVSWRWKFGDGNSDIGNEADGQKVQYTFDDPGRYNVMLTVADSRGFPMNTFVPVTVTPSDRAILSFWIKDSFRENTTGYFQKEILLDGVRVWQEDIAGDQKWKHVCVDVTDHVYNKTTVRLALRVTCLRDISFPVPLNLYSYTGLVDLFVFLDDVTLFGFDVKNGDFESGGNWFYSEGNGTLPSYSVYAGEARSGYKSYMITFPYLSKPVAGAWAQVEQIVTNQEPCILAHSPDSAQVLTDSEVSVTFSEPMNRPATEGAFSISPPVTGKLQWVENKMIFKPDGGLLHKQRYTIFVDKTATDLAGKPLSSVFVSQFTAFSEPPVVVYPNPWIQGNSSGPIRFSNLPAHCSIEIFDMTGRTIASLSHHDMIEGGIEEWDPSGYSGGIFIYIVKHHSGIMTGKFNIVK